jgi:ADP-ribosyl-[dinitrogen reductase] hydrolase
MNMNSKTSESYPLRIAEIILDEQQKIGFSLCPGKTQDGAMSGNWKRDLEMDLERIRSHGYDIVVSLIESEEFVELKVEAFHSGAVQKAGMEWIWVPILDQKTPTQANHAGLNEVLAEVKSGKSVFVHCKGGLGRAGSVTAWLLTHFERSAPTAIAETRLARKGKGTAIENIRQESWVTDHAGRLLGD